MLQFYVIESPSSQPRNAILGQFVSGVIGVAINKAFPRMPDYRHDDLRWLAGAMACPCSITAMALTGTVHPPGGATALIAVTDPSVGEIGWAFLPMVLLNCIIMLAVALLVKNIQRVRYPAYTGGRRGRSVPLGRANVPGRRESERRHTLTAALLQPAIPI